MLWRAPRDLRDGVPVRPIIEVRVSTVAASGQWIPLSPLKVVDGIDSSRQRGGIINQRATVCSSLDRQRTIVTARRMQCVQDDDHVEEVTKFQMMAHGGERSARQGATLTADVEHAAADDCW
jgi:hypothetical protein